MYTLFAFTYTSHICSRRHKQTTFSGEFFTVFKGLNLQQEVGCNRSASLCKVTHKVVQLKCHMLKLTFFTNFVKHCRCR